MKDRSYAFFLSYAPVTHIADAAERAADHWVQTLFQDLSEEVARLLGTPAHEPVGFFDELIPPGRDVKADLAEAIGAAHVFVALYSQRYFGSAWSMSERAAFLRRLEKAHTRTHLVPVLWAPFPSLHDVPELGPALTLGDGVPEYAENGLMGLCRLAVYRQQYQVVLTRLAHRVADIVEHAPLPRSRSVMLERAAELVRGPRLAIAILTVDTGEDPSAWRPYADAAGPPIAYSIAQIAERLGFAAQVVDLRAGAAAVLRAGPALVLIDPWLLAGQDTDGPLAALARFLHPWVSPLLLADRSDPRYAERGDATIADVTGRLQSIGAATIRPLLDVEEVATFMPMLVIRAYRQFVNTAMAAAPARTPRPRLADGLAAQQPEIEETDR
ncbi:TIR-like protein FxsC [Dactylosporangium sp. NPDC050688]|uniref:TIR-like protein FxsC n=1 Tax=Dactylosporangium sp. NPDC050688 TaxID=3157217 RepID=UPI0033BFCB77